MKKTMLLLMLLAIQAPAISSETYDAIGELRRENQALMNRPWNVPPTDISVPTYTPVYINRYNNTYYKKDLTIPLNPIRPIYGGYYERPVQYYY